MRIALILTLACSLAACAIPPKPHVLHPTIVDELNAAAAAKPQPAREAAVEKALLPPLNLQLPQVDARALEPRFDLSVNNAPATQVLLSIVSGTRYSMLVHPDVNGSISVNLKDVTVREALDALRDLYGYEYRIEGNHIFVQAPSLQTRVFRVNYLAGQRVGRSELRVISGSVADVDNSNSSNSANSGSTPGQQSRATDSSRIVTSTQSDFWRDLAETLKMIVGNEPGRSVVVNSQAGVIVVRGMPGDMRNVTDYLRAIKLSVERQIMLEAKIIEVTLSDSFQSGVNWAAFGSNLSAGILRPGTTLGTTGDLVSNRLTSSPGHTLVGQAALSSTMLPNVPGGSLFGLAFQTSNFAALLEFLEGQGSVQVLSSPRIATLNNQKAVLKVGTDEFFITNVQSGSVNSSGNINSGGTNTFPTLTLQPFFSGVALDITPQIDEASNVILHIHPSVSNVTQDDRNINLGEAFGGNITLPLARSAVSETDSVVKVSDSNIVAIGGLMKVDLADRKSGLPGAQDVPVLGALFGSRDRLVVKKELVILIKPTIIGGETDPADVGRSRDRILEMGTRPAGDSGTPR